MNILQIKSPFWDNRKVGVATDRITDEGILVEILYKDSSGSKIYPHLYYMEQDKALKYQNMTVKGRELKIIPIEHFQSMKLKKGVEV